MSHTPPKAKEGIEEQIEIAGTLHDGGGVVGTSSNGAFISIDYVKQVDETLTFKLILYQPNLKAIFQEQVKEIIGEDEKASFDDKYKAMYFGVRNQLRDEQRKLQERYL